ncbi:MAG: hypothetical protein LBU95_00690, partial [Rikenellaceae bacterium]|nr:hypothetical protein [Rikenellaceae bacterium]
MKDRIPWGLVTAKLRGVITPQQEAELIAWLNASGNQSIYNELCTLWETIRVENARYEPDANAGWTRLRERMDNRAAQAARRKVRLG